MSASQPFAGNEASFDCLEAIGALGEERCFASGQVIFRTGDPGDGFHVVTQGRVAIRGGSGGEEDRVLARIESGDFFGEMAVLDEAVRSASAVAEEETRTRFLGREEFLRLLGERPGFALQLIRAFSARLRSLNQRYVEDMLQSERLATVGRLARATVHDFKNPLAVISLAAEVATQPGVAPAMAANARRSILTQVAHMNSLLHELIEYTKSGRTSMAAVPMDLVAFARGEVEGLREELAQRKVSIGCESSVPSLKVRGDSRRLSRLLRNLAANAVDAMGKAGGTIAVSLAREADEAVLTVRDSGPGIAPEIAARLFEPFATFGKEHGTGLGLSICRRIAEDHGGRIWIEGGKGGGAAFAIALPLL
jgi:signal transduction histidine kinase